MEGKSEGIYRDLISNKDFKEWVLNPTEDRDLYWKKWIEVHPEYQEAYLKARSFILNIRFKEHQLDEDKLDAILANIISDKEKAGNNDRKSDLGRNRWYLVAATLFVLFLAGFLLRDKISLSALMPQEKVAVKQVHNPEGRKSRIRLPDGSLVDLNSESTLTFPEIFNDTVRLVKLSGEAYFDIAHVAKKPFRVKTETLSATALGTEFNMRSYGSERETSVALVSGSVLVSSVNQQTEGTMLSPGEKLSFNKETSTYTKTTFDSLELSWKNEALEFKNTPFEGFVKLLEQWYRVDIVVVRAPTKEWRVNGYFKDESLEEVLIDLQYTYDIIYQIHDDEVYLTCK